MQRIPKWIKIFRLLFSLLSPGNAFLVYLDIYKRIHAHWYIADLLALRHWKMSHVVMVITSERIEFITSECIGFITSAEGTSDKFNAS